MTPRPQSRRLTLLVSVASLSLLAVTVPTADAAPDPTADPRPATRIGLPTRKLPTTKLPTVQRPAAKRLVPNAEARAVGIEAGNAPMGWRTARLEIAAKGVQSALTADGAVSSAASKKLVPMSGVLGIDVASYQKNVNWASYTSQKRVFAYVKATEGNSYRNPYFSSQYGGAAKAGLIRGAYHFANPSGASGKTQADYFVKYGGGWRADGKTLPGVLDIEYNPYGGNTCYGLSKTAMVKWISDFVTQYKKRTNRDAVIYTTADWWKRCTGDSTKFAKTNPLWVARYGTSTPGTLPGKWPFYTFWQYSSSPIDQNKFSAAYSRLQVLARNR
ncbi:lysozyme [Microlunatus ginsengisoli]|uniref:Lyzozyme M1 (1,4-beta-N-acetylmuramidase), GH25 family n=1 Tax=Microlunatus ginsengisoli TaxID=363863 RepID=A0ABP6ZJ17_9ACTN